jgi:hypothetical protein
MTEIPRIQKTITVPVEAIAADHKAVASAALALDRAPIWYADYRQAVGTPRREVSERSGITESRLAAIETGGPLTAAEASAILGWVMEHAIEHGYAESADIGEASDPEPVERAPKPSGETISPDATV